MGSDYKFCLNPWFNLFEIMNVKVTAKNEREELMKYLNVRHSSYL